MTTQATLSHAAARTLYDRIGRWQDTQRFYEDGATADLIAHADLGAARSVFELGAGTGRREAHRLLSAGGLLCLASATHGRTPLERLVMELAARLHSLSPHLIGGCRAIDVVSFLEPGRWQVVHRNVVSTWGITSEVLVARRV